MSQALKLPILNSVVVAGRLVADPKEIPVKGSVGCAMTIAVNRKNGGSNFTVFIPIICWSDVAKAALSHLHKGSPVLVSGALSQSKGTKKELQVSVSALQFLEVAPKKDEGEEVVDPVSSHDAPAT